MEGVVGFILLALWIWAIVDCITSDSVIIRNLPKGVWFILIIILFDIGAILWLLLGRPYNKHWRPTVEGEPRTYPTRRNPAIEDRADFASGISDRRSAELDRQLDAWERDHPTEPPADDVDERSRALDEREAELRRRELGLRARALDERERSLDED